jgi:hypothetical protein
LKGRLRHEIVGEGDDRRCVVWGTFKGEDAPHKYTSETLGKLRDARGRNEFGNVKGSPLWDNQPEVQLAYSAVRQWCRLYASETLLGVYTPDELEDGSTPKDVTPTKTELLTQRLKDQKAQHADTRRGFDAEYVAKQAALSSIIEGDVNSDEAKEGESDERGNESNPAGRQDGSADRVDGDRDQDRSESGSGDDREVGGGPAGDKAPDAEESEEGNAPDRQAKPSPKGKR